MSYLGDAAGSESLQVSVYDGALWSDWAYASVTVTQANQTFIGTNGNDSFTSGFGNDTIDGGAGIDTANYSGNLAHYTLTKSGSSYTVRDNTGSDGTDTLTNIESLKFADMTVNLTIQAISGSAPRRCPAHHRTLCCLLQQGARR